MKKNILSNNNNKKGFPVVPPLEFRNYKLLINLLQVYVFFLVWLRSTKAGLKTDVINIDHRLDIVTSGVLKVQSWEIIMGTGNMNSKLKVKGNYGKMSKWKRYWSNEYLSMGLYTFIRDWLTYICILCPETMLTFRIRRK